MSLRIFTRPVFQTCIPHARAAATTHRRAAANRRPLLLKNMPRRIKRPETRQKKLYWKNWWIKHTTPKELTLEQITHLRDITAETVQRAAVDRSTAQRDVDELCQQLSSSLDINTACQSPNESIVMEQEPSKTGLELPYKISRTGTGNLPTYQLTKAGGSLLQTRIRRVEGIATELKDELSQWLQPTPQWVRVNAVNGHIEMKGWYKDQVDKYLLAKGF